MLAALSCQPVDYAPCCFMQFTALEDRCQDQFEMVYRQLAWGLDATIQIPPWLLTVPGDYADLRGLPVCFHPEVQIRELIEHEEGERYATLSKEYITPAGSLSVRVSKTDDWPYGDHIPFVDDFIIPRVRKPLVTSPVDLKALRYLMISPTDDVIQEFREAARQAKAFAREHDILVAVDDLRFAVPASPKMQPREKLLFFIRPNDIDVLQPGRAGGGNTFDGVVSKKTYLGDKIDYRIVVGRSLELRVQTDGKVRFEQGESVRLRLPIDRCRAIVRD